MRPGDHPEATTRDGAAAMDRQYAANARHRAEQMREQGCSVEMIRQELNAARFYAWRARSWHTTCPTSPPLPRDIRR